MHEKLLARQYCFYIDGIQKCTVVFKLKIFNLRMFSRTLNIKFSFVCSNLSYFELVEKRAFTVYFGSLDLSSQCFCIIKKQRNFQQFIEVKKKISTHDQVFLSSREHPRVLLCCSAPTFMLFHSSLFLKFVNNFEITCQEFEFTLKVAFTL